ncbi:hypothetical protein OCUBac02_30180 [Bosea sp. ANAM02]|nr:hypothetical protein OCUBac02_30180 [Bosea sp. ANAM02]
MITDAGGPAQTQCAIPHPIAIPEGSGAQDSQAPSVRCATQRGERLTQPFSTELFAAITGSDASALAGMDHTPRGPFFGGDASGIRSPCRMATEREQAWKRPAGGPER